MKKNIRTIIKTLFLFIILCLSVNLYSCKEDPIDPKVEEPDDKPSNTKKQFVIYDILSYKGKPDLSAEKFSGIGVFDETYLTKKDAEGKTVLDTDKITALAELAQIKGHKTITGNIASWYNDQSITDAEKNTRLQSIFTIFRSKIQNLKIANYSLPVTNLASFRYNKEGSNEEILTEWRKNNQSRWATSKSGDYYSPIAFMVNTDLHSWTKDVETMIDEIEEKGDKKKIYLYLSPQYESLPNNPHNRKFIDQASWKKILETAYELCDGVILTGFATDESNKEISWDDARVQAIFKATKEFIDKHSENIIVETVPETGNDDEPTNKTSFKLFHSITFEATPDLRAKYNINKVEIATEAELSGTANGNGILVPDIQKIEALAVKALKNPDTPVLIDMIDSWMKDKTSDMEAMNKRFQLISETFKAKNETSPLMFQNVGPTSISEKRLIEDLEEDGILYSWFMDTAWPTRGLKKYSDIIVPAVFAIDDDIETWRRDFNKILNEANIDRGRNKPVYAYVWTNYFNRNESYPFFQDAFEPIKEETFLEMLETIYKRCDGVIIVSNAREETSVVWDDNMGIAKAISTFYENHKEVIGEAPEEVIKQFAIFDALSYPGKPSLADEGLLPVNLIYEVHLTKPDPANPNRVILDIDKVNNIAELATEFPDVMVSTDVEDWFGLDQYEMSLRFSTIFRTFREKNPSVVIGNYGIAPSALCVYRFYDGGATDDGVLVSTWRRNNERRWKSLESADVAMPVAYIAEPNIDSWVRDLRITVEEIKKYSNKKIYVYIWPQYYDKPDSPYFRKFVSPEIWEQMLEASFQYCDGVILWSSIRDEFDQPALWNRSELQAVWAKTKEFISSRSENIIRPKPEPERIFLDDPNKKFKIFSSLSYNRMPDLTSQGIHNLRVVHERDLSDGALSSGNIYEPIMTKVEALAQQIASTPDVPVFITGGTWIRDRSTNHQAMVNRHKNVRNTFKNKNSRNELLFANVGPSSLSGLRVSGANFFTNMASWKSTANMLRPLQEYAEILVPASYIVDDDIDFWKKEFYLTIKDAKQNNPDKPVYAHFYADYFNNANNFPNAYRPISESTFTAMLENAFKICDGVILTNLTGGNWNEEFGFWKALQKFIDNHGANIEFPKVSP